MYTIAKTFAFSASHIIGGLPAEHPCARLHGHNYEVMIVLELPLIETAGAKGATVRPTVFAT